MQILAHPAANQEEGHGTVLKTPLIRRLIEGAHFSKAACSFQLGGYMKLKISASDQRPTVCLYFRWHPSTQLLVFPDSWEETASNT